MFVGRKKEIEALNAFYEGDKKAIACITGSIGMGKTALLRHFAEGKKSVFFCGYETTKQQEIALFGQAVGIKKAATLQEVLDKITAMAKKEKILLVMDQYPNFAKADAEFDEVFHSYVTKEWNDLPVKVVLCGDAFLLMEKTVYGKKAKWKNDLDVTICLKGLPFYESKEFFPAASAQDVALLYGLSGGIPGYIIRIQGKSPKEAAKIIFASSPECAALLPEQVMGKELRELSYYNCILSVMAQGVNRVNQLSEAVEKPKDVVVPYLNALMSIGMVTKQNAITEETNRKKTRYSIVNNNTVFWYRYIVPNMDLYIADEWDELWDKRIVPELDDFMQRVFIEISREYIEKESTEGSMPFDIERTGNWWTNDDEAGTTEGFDIVSLGKSEGRSATIFTLCFYEDRAIEVIELKELIEKTKRMHREGDAFYVACSKKGFHENAMTVASTIKNIILIQLEEMCK